jgi:hypothetical protein
MAKRAQRVAEGSGQSAASRARGQATQPRLPATPAGKEKKAIDKKKKSGKAPKKLLDLKTLRSPSSSASKKSYKASTAVYTLIKAKYQKGDKQHEFTGAIYFRGKPCYGNNEKFKQKVGAVLLKEYLRFNDELKLYTAKVYTIEQAEMVLDAAKQVSPEDEKCLAGVTVDPTIFDGATEASVKMFPLEVDGELNYAIGGSTYPWGKVLEKAGFGFKHIVNGEPLNLWLRVEPEGQPDVTADDLQAEFERYGFNVERFDGVEDDEDDDEDDDDDDDDE